MVFNTDNGLCDFAIAKLKKGDAILIKGSRCMRLEELYEKLVNNLRKKATV